MTATIKDVARTAGVSVATVSRVLNGHSIDNYDGAVRMARHLHWLGRRRIGFIAGEENVSIDGSYGHVYQTLTAPCPPRHSGAALRSNPVVAADASPGARLPRSPGIGMPAISAFPIYSAVMYDLPLPAGRGGRPSPPEQC